jgi:hypothetical protein
MICILLPGHRDLRTSTFTGSYEIIGYEEKKSTRDALLHRILDAAEETNNNPYIIEGKTNSIMNPARKYIEVEGSQCEHLLKI